MLRLFFFSSYLFHGLKKRIRHIHMDKKEPIFTFAFILMIVFCALKCIVTSIGLFCLIAHISQRIREKNMPTACSRKNHIEEKNPINMTTNNIVVPTTAILSSNSSSSSESESKNKKKSAITTLGQLVALQANNNKKKEVRFKPQVHFMLRENRLKWYSLSEEERTMKKKHITQVAYNAEIYLRYQEAYGHLPDNLVLQTDNQEALEVNNNQKKQVFFNKPQVRFMLEENKVYRYSLSEEEWTIHNEHIMEVARNAKSYLQYLETYGHLPDDLVLPTNTPLVALPVNDIIINKKKKQVRFKPQVTFDTATNKKVQYYSVLDDEWEMNSTLLPGSV